MTTTDTTIDRPGVVVWINAHRALVARAGEDGTSMVEIDRGRDPELQYLAHIVHEIGNGERVTIVGSEPMRLALEREYVSISHRPDRLISVPPIARADGALIVERLLRPAA
jgi:hypothetical protein